MFSNIFNSQSKSSSIYLNMGDRVGGYKVVDIAGPPGGTATAYIGEGKSGKQYVIKRFYPEKVSRIMRERIYEEANLNLQSSYLVTSMAVFEEDGFIHSVLPYIRGKSLSDILCCGDGVSEKEAIRLGTHMAIAACDLHRKNILFTDIKPENILINNIGHIKMIDLTCFERIGCEPEISLGTPPYAAPELAERKKLSAATDIYSIGMVLYEAVIGTNSFSTQGENLQLSSISGKCPKLHKVIARAVTPNPKKRYQTARSMLNDLERIKKESFESSLNIWGNNGVKLAMKPGNYILGRDELAPHNFYMSQKQFEFDYDGMMAKVRDIAKKNKAFLDNTLMTDDWLKLNNQSKLKIANIDLKFNFK